MPFAAQVSIVIHSLSIRDLQIVGALHKQLRDMLDIMLVEHDMLQYVSK